MSTVAGTKFEIDEKYRIIKPIGHGAYGVVVCVRRLPRPDPCTARKPPCLHPVRRESQRQQEKGQLLGWGVPIGPVL